MYKIKETWPIGYGIIVANKFENTEHHRSGTAAEIVLMKEIFTKLGFQPIIFGEVTREGFLQRMSNIENDEKLNEHSIIALAIFSHGEQNCIFFPKQHIIQNEKESVATGQHHYDSFPSKEDDNTRDPLLVADIKNSICYPSMDNKPKLMILNACRGSLEDAEVHSTDKFILYSTKERVISTKFEYGSYGALSPFLRMLYKSVSELSYYDDFSKIDEKINKHYQKLPGMENCKLEQAEMVIEEKASSRELRLRLHSYLSDLDELLAKSVQKIDKVQLQKEKIQTIKAVKSATSIAYNKKQGCYYICDLLQSKIVAFNKDSKSFPIILDPPLKSPRYIECIDAGNKLVISHELGLSTVKLRAVTTATYKYEKLGKDITYISPCIALDKNKGIIYILNRFGNEKNNHRQIISWHFTDNTFHEGIVELPIEPAQNYSPIITDMTFRTEQILVLAYLPIPHLLTYNISQELNKISLSFVPQLITNFEPCFIASIERYTLLSSPKAGILKLPQLTENLHEQTGIKNTNAVYIHEEGDAIITAINGNECIIHNWKGIAEVEEY